jgi:hypothetical protein
VSHHNGCSKSSKGKTDRKNPTAGLNFKSDHGSFFCGRLSLFGPSLSSATHLVKERRAATRRLP